VRFYISDDFNEHSEILRSYLINEGCKVRMIDVSFSKIDKRIKSSIDTLINYNQNIFYHIITGSPYSFDININDLFNILPMSKKESGRYSSLIETLKSMNVFMNIITNNWNL
jgi:hypothetical protein